MLVDSHCHLNYDGLRDDKEGVLARARAVGVSHFLTINTCLNESAEVVQIAETYPVFRPLLAFTRVILPQRPVQPQRIWPSGPFIQRLLAWEKQDWIISMIQRINLTNSKVWLFTWMLPINTICRWLFMPATLKRILLNS